MSRRKEHVIDHRWSVGMFHKDYFVRCRCGWVESHYNARHLTELFKEHAAGSGRVSETGEA